MCFPPVFRGESRKEYVKRCINMNTIAKRYPNRTKRKEVIEDYFRSVPLYSRNGKYSPGKTLFQIDAAAYLGVARGTLRYWEYKGYLTPNFIITNRGRKLRVYQKDILDKIKEVRNEAIAEKQKARRNKMDS